MHFIINKCLIFKYCSQKKKKSELELNHPKRSSVHLLVRMAKQMKLFDCEVKSSTNPKINYKVFAVTCAADVTA